MRLFVAIDVSQEIKDYISQIQKKMKLGSFTNSETAHITLKYLGDVNPDETKRALGKITSSCFKLTTSDFGFFKGTPNVFWLGIEESQELNELFSKIDLALSNFKREFPLHPHITIARLNEMDETFVKSLPKKQFSFQIDKFRLYNSDLTKIKSKYIALEDFTLV